MFTQEYVQHRMILMNIKQSLPRMTLNTVQYQTLFILFRAWSLMFPLQRKLRAAINPYCCISEKRVKSAGGPIRRKYEEETIQQMNWNLVSLHCFLVQDTDASNSKLPMHSMSQLHKTTKHNSLLKVQTQKTSKAAQRQFLGGKRIFKPCPQNINKKRQTFIQCPK